MASKIEPIFELERVKKVFHGKRSFIKDSNQDVVALNDVSLTIAKGEIFGLVGQSGSGKTTAGRLIVKLDEPQSGRILMEGEDITRFKRNRLKRFRRRVQMIFQDPYQSLNPYLSVYDSVCEPLAIHSMGDSQSRPSMVREALQSAGLSPVENFLYRYPHQLSGGQRQRVAIARAIVLKPEFIVADEPTSMLDASISIQIFNIISELRDAYRVTFLFITHSLAAARYMCDRIAVIYQGEIVETGTAEEVIGNPRHDYTRALINAHPKFHRHSSR